MIYSDEMLAACLVQWLVDLRVYLTAGLKESQLVVLTDDWWVDDSAES